MIITTEDIEGGYLGPLQRRYTDHRDTASWGGAPENPQRREETAHEEIFTETSTQIYGEGEHHYLNDCPIDYQYWTAYVYNSY